MKLTVAQYAEKEGISMPIQIYCQTNHGPVKYRVVDPDIAKTLRKLTLQTTLVPRVKEALEELGITFEEITIPNRIQ